VADFQTLLAKQSFIELSARERAKALLDEQSFRELLDPFARMMSPWLPKQNIVPQADDGVVVAKGTLQQKPVVINPKVFLQVSDIFTLISMVSSGVGLALLPGRISTIYESSVKLIRLKAQYQIKQQIGLVFLKSKERDPNLLAFIAECRMFSRHV